MKDFKYVITDSVGIHARPAGLLVTECKKYQSSITISYNGKQADARRLMMLIALGIKNGQEITVSIIGEDEEVAAVKLEEFFSHNL